MKTLLVSEIFPPRHGGSGRWFWEIYRRLPREQICIAAGVHEHGDQFDRAHDLSIHRIPLALRAWGLRSLAGLGGYWRAVRRLLPIVRTERIEMIHCGRSLPEGVMALAIKQLTGVPYACYAHGEDVNTASTSRELRWLTSRVLAGAEFTVANSRNTQRILESEWGVPSTRVPLLFPGVDTRRFVPAPRNETLRRELGWSGRTVVLTVGRLQKRKGHDQMIRALALVRQAVPSLLYAIIGDGEERQRLEELVSREGLGDHVQFLGEPDDAALVRCYQQCDLFVLPNRAVGKDIEGFGMVLLEAQACGRPVLAGASGGTAETMDIPHTGQVVACEQPGPLAAAVVELLLDPGRRACMGETARQWVVDHFDWSSLARQAAELFQTTRASRKAA